MGHIVLQIVENYLELKLQSGKGSSLLSLRAFYLFHCIVYFLYRASLNEDFKLYF